MDKDEDYHLLNQKLRKVFTDHVVYTRIYIINELLDLKGDAPLIARLIKNQEDIGSIFRECGISDIDCYEIVRLFKDHIYIATDLIDLIKSGDIVQQTEISTRWHMNAVEIAICINSIVPSCDRNELRTMLFNHLLLTQDEISDYYYKMYEQSIVKFDIIVEQILEMADYLCECLYDKGKGNVEKVDNVNIVDADIGQTEVSQIEKVGIEKVSSFMKEE